MSNGHGAAAEEVAHHMLKSGKANGGTQKRNKADGKDQDDTCAGQFAGKNHYIVDEGLNGNNVWEILQKRNCFAGAYELQKQIETIKKSKWFLADTVFIQMMGKTTKMVSAMEFGRIS